MVGIRLIIIMAIVGGFIAYLADKMGSKIGKKKMSVFGLRPKHTSILLTVTGGTIIAVLTIGVMAVSSQSARTALFGMDKLQKELKLLNAEKAEATVALDAAKERVEEQKSPTNRQWCEIFMRINIPLASFFFAMIGACLGTQKQRTSSSIGLGISVIVIFIYYAVMTFTTGLGKGGAMPPLLACALPNILCLGIGLYFMKKKNI